MVALTNFSTLTAINTTNSSKSALTASMSKIATGKIPDFGQRAHFDAQIRSFEQGVKNLTIHAGRYESFAGTANAITAIAQQKAELAARFSQEGLGQSEYNSAGVTFVALDTYMSQLIASAPIGSGAFNAIKTDAFATGRAITAGPATRAWQRAANSNTVTGFAAAVADTAVNSAAEFANLIPALTQEIQNAAESAAALGSIATAATIMSEATAEEVKGFISASQTLSTDFAQETAELAAHKIRNEAAAAMVSQASQTDRILLSLID